jgi:hypothetical protein
MFAIITLLLVAFFFQYNSCTLQDSKYHTIPLFSFIVPWRRLARAPPGTAAAVLAVAVGASLSSSCHSEDALRAAAAAHRVPRFTCARNSSKLSESPLACVEVSFVLVAGEKVVHTVFTRTCVLTHSYHS